MMNADRARLARELHDGIAQDLVGVGYSLDLLLANPETSLEARAQIRTLRFTVTELIDKVRREIYFLRKPPAISLTQIITDAAHEHSDEIRLQLAVEEIPLGFDSELLYEVQRIAQEIFRNIVNHAQARVITVSLQRMDEMVELCIADDGIGGAVASDERYGIQGIRDRAAMINGVIDIASDKSGTRISLQIPITQNSHE